MVQSRRKEARRSVLVQVSSESSFGELYKYCSGFGSVKGIHHYTLKEGINHFMLVEFSSKQDVDALVSDGVSFTDDTDVIPVSSPLLWFRVVKNPNKGTKKVSLEDMKLSTEDGLQTIPDNTLMLCLQKCTNVAEQISTLYESTVLNDLGTRLRFMVARQIEVAMSSLHTDASVWPFGSSVNSFGKMGCDLDLVFRMGDDTKQSNPSNRLVFHTKKTMVSARTQQQRYIELIADVIQLYLPGCCHIRRILQARIPIVKYNQDYTGLECDLSMTNMSGVYMSELLYLYGNFDYRVRPLVFAVRKWAASVGLTNASPGKWITNFPLTLLVLFYLQQNTRQGTVLPSLKALIKAARQQDVRITEDHINCTFLRDIRNFPMNHNNNDNLGILLLQFFEFYSTFDFETLAISIYEGKAVSKLDHSPLYIVNPLEMSLNVSKNVSYEECERLRMEVRSAAWSLEGEIYNNKPDIVNTWGICKLFRPTVAKSISNLVKIGNSHRMVKVSDLFSHDQVNNQENVNTENFDRVEKVQQLQDELIHIQDQMIATGSMHGGQQNMAMVNNGNDGIKLVPVAAGTQKSETEKPKTRLRKR